MEREFGGRATVYTNWVLEDERGATIAEDGWATLGRPKPPRLLWDPDVTKDAFPAWWRYRLILGGALLFLPREHFGAERMLPGGAAEEDFWFSLVAFLRGPIVYLDEPTYRVRSHPGQESVRRQMERLGNEEEQLVGLAAQIELLRREAPSQRRLLSALRVQQDLTSARLLRDRHRIAASFAAALRSAPHLFRVPHMAGRLLLTLGYCAHPRLYTFMKRRAYRSGTPS
jgi:hypothetical protein